MVPKATVSHDSSHILGHAVPGHISSPLAHRVYDRTALSSETSTSCCLATEIVSPLHKGQRPPSSVLQSNKGLMGSEASPLGSSPEQDPCGWPGAPGRSGARQGTKGRGKKKTERLQQLAAFRPGETPQVDREAGHLVAHLSRDPQTIPGDHCSKYPSFTSPRWRPRESPSHLASPPPLPCLCLAII